MKILVVSPTPTLPMTAGNRARIHATIGALEQADHDVHLAHIELEPGDPDAMRRAYGERFHPISYQRPPKTKGLARRCARWVGKHLRMDSWYVWGIDDWYDDASSRQLRRLQKRESFDVVLVEYVFMSKALASLPDSVLKVIDTHDVMSHRHRLFVSAGKAPRWFSTTPRQERKGLDRAHLVLAIQDQERQFLQTITRADVVTVGHITPVDNRYVRRERMNGSTLLFVGSDNTINVDGLRHFLDRIYPSIRARTPAARLLLAGRICERIPDAPSITKLGRLDRIRDAYDMADTVINPIQYGTGLNIKTIEALGYGMPVVSTAAGARGLEVAADKALVVAEDDEDFRTRVLEVLATPTLALKLSTNAVIFAEQWNTAQMGMLVHQLQRGSRQSLRARRRLANA